MLNEISFRLEKFEGPLDLLLFLISKHKLDIHDIEISLLLEQYMNYIDAIPQKDLESAGEFLEMAARLIYIKTVALLPSYEEAQEMKKELEGRLIEYSLCKKAAAELKQKFIGSEIFIRNPIILEVDMTYNRMHNPYELVMAYNNISIRDRNNIPVEAKVFSPIVSKRIVSVTSKIIFILKKLYNNGTMQMKSLYTNITDKSEKIATFLAVLELSKSGRITINDDNNIIVFNKSKKRMKNKKYVKGNI